MTSFLNALPLLALLLVVGVANSFAEAPTSEELKSLEDEIETLKKGQQEIRRDLQEIKALLQRARAGSQGIPKDLVLSIEADPFKGSPTAPVTLIEFSDYQCPYCARHVRQTLPQIERDYITTGKVKYVFRDLPLTSIHKEAFKAAEAANCAGKQGKYWEMHDQLFANRKALRVMSLEAHALGIGLDLAAFKHCLHSGATAQEIRDDIAEGQKAGVRGTPTFFLGRTDPNTPYVKPLLMLRGAVAYPKFQKAIDRLLTEKQGN